MNGYLVDYILQVDRVATLSSCRVDSRVLSSCRVVDELSILSSCVVERCRDLCQIVELSIVYIELTRSSILSTLVDFARSICRSVDGRSLHTDCRLSTGTLTYIYTSSSGVLSMPYRSTSVESEIDSCSFISIVLLKFIVHLDGLIYRSIYHRRSMIHSLIDRVLSICRSSTVESTR